MTVWCYLKKTTTHKPSEFFYFYGIQKDTNCRSELKPVFIYTGIHMFTSCSIVQYQFHNNENFMFFIHYKAVQYDSLATPAKRIQTKVTNNIHQNNLISKRTKTHFGDTFTNT